MKILIVEDVVFRQELIRSKVGEPNQFDCTKYAEEGLKLLEEKSYDIVFLDHDLIGMKSGSYLTQNWYEQKDKFKTQKPVVIIHSMNMSGADIMENYLKGVSCITERIPFRRIVMDEVDLKNKVKALMEK